MCGMELESRVLKTAQTVALTFTPDGWVARVGDAEGPPAPTILAAIEAAIPGRPDTDEGATWPLPPGTLALDAEGDQLLVWIDGITVDLGVPQIVGQFTLGTSALRAARRAWLGWTDAHVAKPSASRAASTSVLGPVYARLRSVPQLLVGGAELRLAYSLEPQGRAARLLAAQVRPAIGPPADDRERWGTSGA